MNLIHIGKKKKKFRVGINNVLDLDIKDFFSSFVNDLLYSWHELFQSRCFGSKGSTKNRVKKNREPLFCFIFFEWLLIMFERGKKKGPK